MNAKALNAYLREVRDRPFQLGQHDCLTFTNEAFRRMYGAGWADDWIGRYCVQHDYGLRPLRKDQLRAEFGEFCFLSAVSKRLDRIRHTPPKGALIVSDRVRRMTIDYAMGICVGLKGAFLSDKGVVYLPLTAITAAWVPKHDATEETA